MKNQSSDNAVSAKVYDLSSAVPEGRDHTRIILREGEDPLLVIEKRCVYFRGNFYFPSADAWTYSEDGSLAFRWDERGHFLWGVLS